MGNSKAKKGKNALPDIERGENKAAAAASKGLENPDVSSKLQFTTAVVRKKPKILTRVGRVGRVGDFYCFSGLRESPTSTAF